MQVLTRSRRPRPEARLAFDILVELLEEKGRLDEKVVYDRACQFVALLQRVSGKMVRWKWDFNPVEAKEIGGALYNGMERIRSGQVFQHPGWGEWHGDAGLVWDPTRASVGRAASRNLKKLFFDHVFDLLIEVGQWMRTCQREGCGRFFLYGRPKQAFCSESCAQRVRMARFLEQRKAKASKRPAKTSRRTRGKSRA